MATTTAASTLSWLHSFGGTQNETTKATVRNRVFVVFSQKKAKKTGKKEDVEYLGKKGKLLDVKAGYFRNYLLPMGMAQIITPLFAQVLEMKLEERIEAEKERVNLIAQIFDVSKYHFEIRGTGEYIAELKLHPEITVQVRLNVYAD